MEFKTYLTKKLILVFFFLILSENILYALENKILFKIENEIITSVDLYNEINYLKIMNKDIQNLDKEKIYQIAKNSLIRDKIKEIEIIKKIKKIDYNDEYIDKTIMNYYSKLGLSTIQEFENFFTDQDLRVDKIRKKIAIQGYWNNLIYSLYSNKIKINKEDLKKKIIQNSKQKTISFLLSEIVFGVENKDLQNKKFTLVNESITKEGFKNTALMYSISASSKSGGQLGWISENSLNSTIKDKLLQLKINQFTNPIKIPSGFLILKIDNIRENEKKIDIDEQLNKIIKEKTNEQLNNYSNIYFNKIKTSIQIENK